MDKKPSSPKSVLSHIIDFLLNEGLTLVTGAALGATIALALSYENATAFWGMVGSMLAGLGTVGLLAFGFITSKNWQHQLKADKYANVKLEAARSCHNTSRQLYNAVIIKVSNSQKISSKENTILLKDIGEKLNSLYTICAELMYIKWDKESDTIDQVDNLQELINEVARLLIHSTSTPTDIIQTCDKIINCSNSILESTIKEYE